MAFSRFRIFVMQLSACPRLYCLCTFGVIAATFAVVPAAGQTPRNDEAEIVIGNNEDVKSDEKVRLQQWHDGKAMGSGDKRILEKAAKWYIYRLTLPQFQERIPPEGAPLSQGRSVYDLLRELFALLVLPDPSRNTQTNANQQRYMQEFTAALIEPIERVLQNAKPIARINAAIVLARLGETGDEAVVKPLLKILNDKKQYDAVKLYALKGLKNVFRAKNQQDAEPFKDRDDESDYVRDMLEFMVRKPNLPPNATQEEMEAFKYVRREAIRAVAQTRHALLLKKNKPIPLADRRPAQPALELLRIIRNDGINPAPTFTEQIEAAIGICLMKPRLYPTYQVPHALQHLGLFFVEFADKYEKDRPLSADQKKAPWQKESVRLQEALSSLEAVDASPEDKSTIKGFVAAAKPMLKRIEQKSESNIRDLRKWLESNKSGDTLYKGENATIKTETTE
jgi:hypothetical protein